ATIRSASKNPDVVSTIMPVDITPLADELMLRLEQLAAEHRERDEREGIVRLANELLERLELFTPQPREGGASLVIANLCPVCRERRKAKALAMRRWCTQRRLMMAG